MADGHIPAQCPKCGYDGKSTSRRFPVPTPAGWYYRHYYSYLECNKCHVHVQRYIAATPLREMSEALDVSQRELIEPVLTALGPGIPWDAMRDIRKYVRANWKDPECDLPPPREGDEILGQATVDWNKTKVRR